jgi:hypothetical protein
MGVRVMALAVGFGVLAGVGAAPAAAPEGWAEALISQRSHDFGPVPRGAVLHHAFVLDNRTGESITIADLRASCGCTTGRASTATLAPGQSATIDARMDTRNFVGKKATNLIVTLIDTGGRQAELRLGVSANILSDIVLNPGTIDFGAVARGQPAEQTLTIDRYAGAGWKVERLLATRRLAQYVDATIEESRRDAGGVGYVLTVRLRPDAPAGSVREELRITTDDRETPVVPVLVSAQVRGALTATPSLLTLNPGPDGTTPAQGRFLVRGAQPFAIRAIEGAGAGLEVAEGDASRKALHAITVTYRPDPNALAVEPRRTLRLVTDLPGEPPLELNVVVGAP